MEGIIVVPLADDYVILEINLNDFGGLPDSSGRLYVRLRGSRIAGRMIVDEDDGKGGRHDRCAEHFAGMDNGFVYRSYGSHLMSPGTESAAKSNHSNAFNFRVERRSQPDVVIPVANDGFRRIYEFPALMQRVTNRHDLPFADAGRFYRHRVLPWDESELLLNETGHRAVFGVPEGGRISACLCRACNAVTTGVAG